jgi:aspartate/methionine/tyrosine aminotransferase
VATKDGMMSSPTFDSWEFGIKKMPAADPEVQRAATEMLQDPEHYFERRREADLKHARQVMRRRSDKLLETLAQQDRMRRRERLRQMFAWLIGTRRS